jgi:large repetitive protein
MLSASSPLVQSASYTTTVNQSFSSTATAIQSAGKSIEQTIQNALSVTTSAENSIFNTLDSILSDFDQNSLMSQVQSAGRTGKSGQGGTGNTGGSGPVTSQQEAAPSITSSNNATFTVGTNDSFTVTATGSPTPTFAESGALPNGVTFNDTTGVLSGTPLPGTGGTYAVTLTASNGVTPNATQNFTLTVDQAPSITNSNSTVFNVGTAGTFTVTAGGFPAPTLAESGALPAGVSFNTATGVLSGTPQLNTQGTYTLQFTATNGVGSPATQSFTLLVDGAPAITSANATTFAVATAGTFTVTASGVPSPSFTETGALPNGVSFNNATGVLSGTPSAGTGGIYNLTFTALNGVTPVATQSFTLSVDAAPAITSADATTFAVGTAGTFTVTAIGVPSPSFTETGALPNGVSFNNATGVLTGTPSTGTGGNYTLTITALNGVTPEATQTFILTVDEGSTITSANGTTFAVQTPGTFTVTAGGFPAATFGETGALPYGVSFNTATGVLSGSPEPGTGGVYNLVFSASNGIITDPTQTFTLVVTEVPAITSSNSTTFTVGTSGSFSVTVNGYPGAAIVESGALPSGISFSASSGILSGTPQPGTGGVYNLTFTPISVSGTGNTQNFTLVVNEDPTITSANGTTFTVGASGTFTVTASGYPAASFAETGALPAGVTFSTTSGVLSGTPQVGTGGTYDLTFTPTNLVGAGTTQNFTLIVNQAPAITSASGATFTVGTLGTFDVTASGVPAVSFSESGALPSGVTFNSSTGVLTGIPTSGTGGTFDLTITASNGVGTAATQSFVLTVDQAPAISSASGTVFTVGTAGTFTVTASGSPAPTFTESGTLPSGVFFNDATGVLSGTPLQGAAGTYTLTLTATNGVTPDATQTFTLMVVTAPTITSANSVTFVAGTPGTFDVTATGIPAPALSESGALPAGVSFNASTGLLSGTPAPGSSGTYALTFTATNGVSPAASQSFTLIVDQAPAITSGNSTVFTEGAAGTFTVTATGLPTPTVSETGALPTGVTFNSATDTLSGTPLLGTNGTYPITFTATNAVGADATQSFTLTVESAPVITSANSTTFVVGTAGTFTVTAAGMPTPILGEGGTLPNGISFNATTGALSGTPAPGTGGSYSLTFSAINGVTPSATQTFTLIVDEAPAITSTNSATFTVGTAGTFSLTATGFPAPTFNEAGTLPPGLSFSPTGVLSGTPLPGTGGTFSVTFTPVNSIGVGLGQTFTIVVDEAPAIISSDNATFTVGTPGTFTVLANGFPGSTIAETGTLPNGVTFNSATGELTGIPLPNSGGTYALTFTPTNSVGTGQTQNFILIVDQAPAITSANSATFTVGTNGTFSLTATGFPAPTFNESGALPNGLSFTSAGVLSGTPLPGTGGTYTVTFTPVNTVAVGPGQIFTIIVDEAPVITSVNSATFTVGSTGSFSVMADGFPASTFAETGALPVGVTFNAATGLLFGTPQANTGGTYALTFTPTNTAGTGPAQNFTLVVDQPPAITSDNTTTFAVGTPGSFTVTATGYPAPSFSESGTLPNGLTLNPATGVLSGTPLPGAGGNYIETLTATGFGSPATQTFTINVEEAPAITSANSTIFSVGTGGTFVVTANGFPTATIAESGALPNGVSFNSGNGELSGMPLPGSGGVYPITLTASNGVSPAATQAFTLTVLEIPQITSGNGTTFTAASNGTFTVTANGFPAAMIEETGTLPTGISYNPTTGILSGTPLPGTGGMYDLQFTPVNSAGNGITQNFVLIVQQAPTFTSANSTVFTVGTADNFTVSVVGTPASTFSEMGPLPTGVSFNATTGVLSGTPQTGTGGSYTLAISADNGVTPVATQTFTLIVNEVPQITSANGTTFTVATSGTFQVTASGYPASTFSESGTLPIGVTFNSSTGVLTGTPLVNTSGIYTLQFTPKNDAGIGLTQTFTLIVDQPPAITSGNTATFTEGTFASFNVTATGFPTPTFSETGALPNGVIFNDTTGVLSGTPAAGTASTYMITISAMNGVDPEASQDFTLIVNP